MYPEATVDVYVDDLAAFRALPHPLASVQQLDRIAQVGVKRAKFAAYADAIRRCRLSTSTLPSSFFCDSSTPRAPERVSRGVRRRPVVPFVEDRRHPRPGSPELENQRYINSGVLFFGSKTQPYIDDLHDRVDSSDFWDRHIHSGGLHDNHVLCAYLNLTDVPVRFVSERSFNWQGLRRSDGSLCATIRGPTLVNDDSQELLHLVHFAGDRGCRPIPRRVALGRRPPHQRRERFAVKTPARAVAAVGAAPRPIDDCADDPHRTTTAAVISRAFVDARETDVLWHDSQYVSHPEDVVSTALAVPPSKMTWNGLLCGGAYLLPAEYYFLRSLLTSLAPASVVEFGAGETTHLLGAHAQHVVSLEPFDGPWVGRARDAGTDVLLTPLNESGRIDASVLRTAVPAKVDLLFVDSPNGTLARARCSRS